MDGDDYDSGEDRPEREDEKPQIVVLKTGDLTAEEAAAEEKRLAKGKYTNIFLIVDGKLLVDELLPPPSLHFFRNH